MKIKFATPEYANFTGAFGSIEFVDGVSVTDVSENDVRLYSALTTIEVVGEHVAEKSYDEIKHIPAVSFNLPTLADLQAQAAEVAHNLMAPPEGEPAQVEAPAVKLYSKEELEAIADKEGLVGLRKVGEALNVRAPSIAKLIAAILAKQQPAPAAEFIAAPAEAVTVTLLDIDPVTEQVTEQVEPTQE